MYAANFITCILQNAMEKSLSATKIHFVRPKWHKCKRRHVHTYLGLSYPEPRAMFAVNVNYNTFVGRKKTVVILISPSCSLLKSSSSCAASFVVISISITHYQLFLAYPSLLPSFLNSWQTYGPILAFQVIFTDFSPLPCLELSFC